MSLLVPFCMSLSAHIFLARWRNDSPIHIEGTAPVGRLGSISAHQQQGALLKSGGLVRAIPTKANKFEFHESFSRSKTTHRLANIPLSTNFGHSGER
jgi:hypothetical protein